MAARDIAPAETPALTNPPEQPGSLDRSFVRSVAWTGVAKWSSQILAWASTIIVAGILSPEDYGIMGMASVFLGLVTMLSEFGIGATVLMMRDLDPEQVRQLNGFAVLSGIASFGLIAALSIPIAHFFATPELVAVLIVLGTGFIAAGFKTVPDALLQKDLQFRRLALIEALQSVVLAITMISLAKLGFRYWTLVLGTLLGGLLSTLVAISLRRVGLAWPQLKRLRQALSFGTDLVISRLAWFAYSNSDFLIAGRMLGKTPLGYYNLAWSIASAPVGKISQLLLRVTPAYFSAVQKEPAALRRYLLSVTEGVALLTFPAALALTLVADDFVLLVMGEKWLPAVAPMRLIAVYASLRSITPLLSQILAATGDTKFNMRNSIMAAIVLPIAFVIGAKIGGIQYGTVGIAAAWIIAHPLVLIRLYHHVFKRIEMKPSQYLKALRPAMVGSFWMIVVVLMVRWATGARFALPIRFAAECAAGAATYAFVIFALYRDRLIAFKQVASGK